MQKILIGGSPCTRWSIAQKNNRETTAEGIGWELFKNYLIAKEKFRPDFFLYENNKSAAQPIKDQISKELGTPLQYINSALVAAQNRQRFYAHNISDVPQPEDRGILLRDILESGVCWREKAYTLDANYYRTAGTYDPKSQHSYSRLMVAEPVGITDDGKAYCLTSTYYKGPMLENSLERKQRSMVAEPIRIGTIENEALNQDYDSKQYRVYSPGGKATTLCGQGGGVGAKTGLYACPIETPACLRYERTDYAKSIRKDYEAGNINERRCNMREWHPRSDGKSNTITTVLKDNMIIELASGKQQPIYEVSNGLITIKGKQYPIKLADGFYIIRKLTVKECCRLQTMPDDYCRAVSASQAYKGLGNGWTAEVIIHILKHMNIPLDEEIQVLSMYDGIGTGRYCFDKLGYKNIKYISYEIDKYAMQVANSNYSNIKQFGDAFQVRNDNWRYDS